MSAKDCLVTLFFQCCGVEPFRSLLGFGASLVSDADVELGDNEAVIALKSPRMMSLSALGTVVTTEYSSSYNLFFTSSGLVIVGP